MWVSITSVRNARKHSIWRVAEALLWSGQSFLVNLLRVFTYILFYKIWRLCRHLFRTTPQKSHFESLGFKLTHEKHCRQDVSLAFILSLHLLRYIFKIYFKKQRLESNTCSDQHTAFPKCHNVCLQWSTHTFTSEWSISASGELMPGWHFCILVSLPI